MLYTKPEQASLEKVEDLFRDGKRCENLLNMFSLFSNRFRFKILCVLNEGDFCVNEITHLVGGNTSNVSQQLKLLTLAGYLDKKRDQKLIYYHLVDERIRDLLQFLHQNFGGDTRRVE